MINKEDIIKFVNYDTLKQYGHYILDYFGSTHINNINQSECDKIITFSILNKQRYNY